MFKGSMLEKLTSYIFAIIGRLVFWKIGDPLYKMTNLRHQFYWENWKFLLLIRKSFSDFNLVSIRFCLKICNKSEKWETAIVDNFQIF